MVSKCVATHNLHGIGLAFWADEAVLVPVPLVLAAVAED